MYKSREEQLALEKKKAEEAEKERKRQAEIEKESLARRLVCCCSFCFVKYWI